MVNGGRLFWLLLLWRLDKDLLWAELHSTAGTWVRCALFLGLGLMFLLAFGSHLPKTPACGLSAVERGQAA